MNDLIGKQIAAGLTASHLQVPIAKPSKKPTFKHKCE